MTVHWIDLGSLQHHKAAICCIRIVGHHTYDVLAAKIEYVHSFYGLNGKVTATVADNGSNFVKAFTSFSLPAVDHTSTASDTIVSANPFMDEDNLDPDEGEATFENVCDSLLLDQEREDDLTQVEYELPPHERCASHTLNLVASNDVDKYLSSSPLSRGVYRSAFAKCSTLWNKASLHIGFRSYRRSVKAKANSS